jgi:hypothetical protein
MKTPWDRGGLRSYLVIVALLLARPRGPTFWPGVILLLLGVVLHVYAKGCLRQDQVVAKGGPYRFVRHPFYTATLMIDVSLALMSGFWPLMAFLPVWWFLVYVPVMRREEAYLSATFPEIYPEYQRRLPRLFPFRRPLPAGGERFSWTNHNIVGDTVLPRALRLISYPLFFVIWQTLRARGARPLAGGDVPLLGALVLLVSLHVLARLLSRHLKDRRRLFPERMSVPAVRLATAIVVLGVVAANHWGELELNVSVGLIGALVLLASAALHVRSGPARLIAEGVALAGIAVLCELPWIAPFPVLIYTGLALDARLRRLEAGDAPGAAAPSAWQAPSLAYSLLVVGGLAIAVSKDLF